VQNFTEIGSPIFGGQLGEVWLFFNLQTHKQILSPRLQVTNMDRIEWINAHNTWFQVQMCLFGVSTMINVRLGVQTPKIRNYWGVNRHFKRILQKFKSTNIFKTIYRISIKFDRLIRSPTQRLRGWSYNYGDIRIKNSKTADSRHLGFRFWAIIWASINISAPNLL